MEIRQLKYFEQIYESGSILKAAQNLFVSQQALSKSLYTLEKELGAPLFYRTSKGVIPTPYGQELMSSCRIVISEMENLNKHMSECLRTRSDVLKISVAAGCRYFTSLKVWSGFSRLCPQVTVEANEYTYKQSMALLKNKELDAVIISDIEDFGDYITYDLKTFSRVVLLEKSNPLFRKSLLSIEDLRDEHLALSINDFALGHFLGKCRRSGFEPKNMRHVSDTLYMYEMCSKDHMTGITIQDYFTGFFLPRYPNLCVVPFENDILPYSVCLVIRKNFPDLSVMEILADYLRGYMDEVEEKRKG